MSMWSKLFLAAVAGVGSHTLVFNHGEWHMQAPLILRLYLALSVLTVVVEVASDGDGYLLSLGRSALIVGAYATGLFVSLGLYRVLFHRLRSFPGPFLATTSKFWHVGKCIQTGSKNHLVLDGVYKKYGEFVRTGPNELTIFHPDVFRVMESSCKKAVWYDLLLPQVAVNTTRDRAIHDQRRRIWDNGFTTKALAQYHDRIVEHGRELESQLARFAATGESMDVTPWFYWFSFDVMGHFAFARSFNMLRDKKWHRAIVMLRQGMSLLGPLSPVPWLAQIGFSLFPHNQVVKDWHSMVEWCKQRMTDRINMQPEKIDVSTYLIEASRKNNSIEQDRKFLDGDSIAIIIAGSDTVASTLVFLFYELAQHPDQAEKLFHELSHLDDVHDPHSLQTLPHLNGLINETLRLHPAIPSGGYRDTPPEGVTIAGRYIPGNTTIVAPRYTIGRLESCFEAAHSFVPERWSSRPDMVRNKRAFVPFSLGRYSCVGKNLALAELRFVTALLVKKYRIGFAPGGDRGASVHADMSDLFTAAPGGLELRLTPRELDS